ncbi:hypothetical protein V500_03054 [Pseudogymnoascus sp. VKM F-4518 (FW-2643)]|nr:hypothetical protein V500_03054 [Pseudogymnoascus sp. VKM F-4518 (FW-2643)]
MFRNRTSQKPSDELYARFKANFSSVVGVTSDITASSKSSLDAVADASNLATPGDIQEWMKDLDPTPKAQHGAWRFTPSTLDPNSSFSTSAKQIQECYTPGGAGITLYHSQAGDLHTPEIGVGVALRRPLLMQVSETGAHGGPVMDLRPYTQVMPHDFQTYGGLTMQATQEQSLQSYAPAAFLHHDTGYETMDHDGSPMHDSSRIGHMEVTTTQPMTDQPQQYEMNVASQIPPSAEDFRFHVPILPVSVGTRYRTSLRISFEDEQQRQRPASCWQLWKEGRGISKAPRQGGKLHAIEYVDATQQADSDDKRTRVELETASFDGFSIVWAPGAAGLTECNLAVRFNFLSTDFSHSKGVKGIPVRFCAKTVDLGPSLPHAVPPPTEVAYCKVKLFRAHGAERKLSNDVAHVKKTIDKLKRQFAQSEASMKASGKRKRNSYISKSAAAEPSDNVPKHEREQSTSSASSAGGLTPVEEDLHYKLQQQQDVLTSTRPVSILHLCGAEQDDPDLHPIALPGPPWELTKFDLRNSTAFQRRPSMLSNSTASNSFLASPSQSSTSLHSQAVVHGVAIPMAVQWVDGADVSANSQHLASPPDKLTKIPKMDDAGRLSGWIEALGVDDGYHPPLEHVVKSVACFYVLYRDAPHGSKKPYYRAVYLTQRTLSDLLAGIGRKWGFDPSTVRRSLHFLTSGLEVEMDDDRVREMRDGQDVVLQVEKLSAATTTKREWEWEMTSDEEGAEGNSAERELCEIRLLF